MPDVSPEPGTTIGSPAGRGHDARRALAAVGEQRVAEHLERLGYDVLARNHRTRHGELDLVVTNGTVLAFVEVKTRRQTRGGADPWQALDARKQVRVRRMARAYLRDVVDRPHGLVLRFDAVGVIIDARGRLLSLDHREGAF